MQHSVPHNRLNINALRKVQLFASLPDAELKDLLEVFQYREHAEGEILFQEGDPGGAFYIVLDGEVDIVKALGTPEELVLFVVREGDYLGELGLLNPEGTRTAGTRTRSRVKTMEMTRADFEALINRRPNLGLDLVRDLIIRLRSGQDAAIRNLEEKNRTLAKALDDLKAAQDQLIEQEKLAHELDIAARIQAGLLPKELPEVPGRQIQAHWQPARFVGGDFYDFIRHPDGRLSMIVADVSGKGVPAALVMATTRSLIRPAAQHLVSPGEVLEQVNELLFHETPAAMFTTCLYLLLDPATGLLRFANAGHCLPFLCSTEEVIELWATGMPLGLMQGMRYEEGRAHLGEAASLLMFSDGLIEAHSPEGEMFGTQRLQAVLAKHLIENRSTRQLLPRLLDELNAFTGPGWEREDDVTLLSMEPENT